MTYTVNGMQETLVLTISAILADAPKVTLI